MAQDPRSFSPTPVEANQAEDLLAEDLEAEGAHQGIGRRDGSPADREHGIKTRAYNRDIISGRV